MQEGHTDPRVGTKESKHTPEKGFCFEWALSYLVEIPF